MKTDIQLGSFSHAHCFNCKYLAEVDKFDWRKNVIAASGMELIQLRLICPICQDEHCEGLFPNEVN
jgi:hypothetical protein